MDMRLMTSGLGHHRLLMCAVQCAWYAFSTGHFMCNILTKLRLSEFFYVRYCGAHNLL